MSDYLTDDELDALADMGVSGLEPYMIGARRQARRGGPIVLRRSELSARGPRGGQRAREQDGGGPALGGRTRGQFLQPSDQRRRMLGLGRVTIAAGDSGQLQAKCEKAIQPEKLVVSCSSLADIVVNDIKIGVASQMSSTEEMPAEAFRVDQTGYIECDAVRVGQDVTVLFTNTSAGSLTVSAAMFGPAAE